MKVGKVNLNEKFGKFDEHWAPKIVGELNNQLVKIAKFKGEFVMHHHGLEDELFYVIEGTLNIELEGGVLEIEQGEFVIVPKGIKHKPFAKDEVKVLLFEPASTRNTGEDVNEHTVDDLERIWMKMKYAHTNIVCRDWKRLSAFYIHTFQCEVVPPTRRQSGDWLASGTGLKDASLEGVHLLLPGYGKNGPTLEIYQYEAFEEHIEIEPNTRGFGHIAFEVEDVKETLSELIKNGGSEFGSITKRQVEGVGEITFVYCRDPEGNLIELQSWEKDSLAISNKKGNVE